MKSIKPEVILKIIEVNINELQKKVTNSEGNNYKKTRLNLSIFLSKLR